MANAEAPVILFDGICNLCSGIVKFIIRRDPHGKFRFAALQSDRAQAIIKRYGIHHQPMRTFIFIHGDKWFVKSTAALHVFKVLGGLWKMLYIFIVVPRPIRDFLYDIVAKTRYTLFGTRDSCMIPDSDERNRFL
jgi:predicted DCC family thiol-disulfide oxidoreductase YuxK